MIVASIVVVVTPVVAVLVGIVSVSGKRTRARSGLIARLRAVLGISVSVPRIRPKIAISLRMSFPVVVVLVVAVAVTLAVVTTSIIGFIILAAVFRLEKG